MATAPFLKIADDLRRRIDAGELTAGMKAPSTRRLSSRWKVATATAAHALQVLVNEGRLRAVPRSGYVVAGLPTRRGIFALELSRERLVSAALEIADAEGLDALSLRGLAAKLKAPVMSLYRHVRNKAELLSLMTDAALGEEVLPEPPPKGWRAQLELGARLEWKVLRRHPWLARVVHISRPTPLPNAAVMADWVMRALDGSALGAAAKLQVHVVLHAYLQGLAVNLEAEAQAVGETGLTEDDHMRAAEPRFLALAQSGKFPYFAKMLRGIPPEFDMDFDVLFEVGLKGLLDGLAPVIEGRRGAAGRYFQTKKPNDMFM